METLERSKRRNRKTIMGYIATSKFGDCSRCPAKNTNCKKRGKYLLCIQCCNSEDAHKQISKQKITQQKRQIESKVRGLLQSDTNLEMAEENKVRKAEMDLFWMTAEREIATHPYCSECGTFIGNKKTVNGKLVDTKEFYRAATAHVLQKREIYGFPSIAANLDNYIILGAGCGCHFRYDCSWEDAAQMKIFSVAIEKFKKLYPHIALSERKNIPEIFRQEIL